MAPFFNYFKNSIIEFVLKSVIGSYVEEINKEKFEFQIWNGVAELRDLEIKREALDALRLPIAVSKGVLGHLKIVVPWDDLQVLCIQCCFLLNYNFIAQNSAVVLEISDICLVAKPLSSFKFDEEAETEKLHKKKMEKLEVLPS